MINLKTGKALQGVLFAKRGPLLVLKDVSLHESGQKIPLDGDVVTERSNVDFIQVAPSEASR